MHQFLLFFFGRWVDPSLFVEMSTESTCYAFRKEAIVSAVPSNLYTPAGSGVPSQGAALHHGAVRGRHLGLRHCTRQDYSKGYLLAQQFSNGDK